MQGDIISFLGKAGRLGLIVTGLLVFTLNAVAEEDHMMSKTEQKEIVNKVCDFLVNNYVYPDVGEHVSKQIRDNHENGKYSKLTSTKEFAREFSADLDEISHDKHLRVVYDPAWVKGLKEQSDDKDAYLTEDMIEQDRQKNFGFKEIRILDGNIGYLDLTIFYHPKYAGETAVAAMNFLSNCDAVIIDVRNNGGGWGYMVAFLGSYFVDNEELVQWTSVYSRPEDKTYQSWSVPYVPGRIMSDVPLYILTSKSTFSAAEEFCYNLQQLKRATIVGENTRGGAHPVDAKVLNDYLVLIMPEWRSIHPVTKTDWEGVGVKPDINVAADEALYVAHVQALEGLLARTQDEDTRRRHQWHIDGIKAKRSPATVDSSLLQTYAGQYGTYKITYENGNLNYERGGRAQHEMVAMTEDLFMIKDVDHVRVKFLIENGIVKGVLALYDDGTTSEYRRERGQEQK